MFLRQVYFYSCRRFHTEFLKTPSSAELHFDIALQRTNIVPGSKTVLRRLLPGSPRQVKSEDFNI